MDILPLPFRTLTYCGIWLQDNSSFGFLRASWGFLLTTMIIYFTLIEVIDLYFLRDSVDDFTDVMFVSATYILLCLKIFNFKVRHKSLLRLLENFREQICQPNSPDEERIVESYTSQVTKIFRGFLGLTSTTGVFFCILPFMTLQSAHYELPFSTYQFYDDTTIVGFSATYLIQLGAAMFGILINVSMDTMTYGFIILATSQFELISYRITKSAEKNDKRLLQQCVIHHVHMKKIVRRIQQVFMDVIASLFIVSLLILCATIFQMSQVNHFYY